VDRSIVFAARWPKEQVVKDHLAALFFTPAASAGQGTYLPGRFDLRLRGDAEQRRALAVTAIARACMQTPVLDRMILSWPEALTLGSLPRLDVPDERFAYLLKDPDLSATAGGAADAAVAGRFGTAALDADRAGGGALDDVHDQAWALWENIVFDRVSDELRAVGAVVLGSNDHLDDAAGLAALVVRAVPGSLAREFCGGSMVHGLYLDLGPSPFGVRRGVVFKVAGGVGVWLAIADEVGIELLVQEVAGLPGIDLRMTGGEWARALSAIRLVLLDLLRTESYVDLRGHADGARP
jgi:hypothetical protein